MATRRFRIKLQYREPTYELTAGRKAEPYSGGSFEITASHAVEALQIALDRFESLQRLSNVGWVREVVRIEIEVLPAEH